MGFIIIFLFSISTTGKNSSTKGTISIFPIVFFMFNKSVEELFEIMKQDKRINDNSNLITYCKECHLYKIHGYADKKSNYGNKKT